MQPFGEIRIVRPRAHLEIWGPNAPRCDPATAPLPVAEVLGQLEDLHRRGVRVVLLTINALGGHTDAGAVLYDALRAFCEAGGAVLAHVAGYAASVWSWVVLADYLVMDPGAHVLVHGEVQAATGRGQFTSPAAAERYRLTLALLESRTLTPRAELEEWLALRPNDDGQPFFAKLTAQDALALGWADFAGSAAAARAIAARLATGAQVPSGRRLALADRGERPEWRQAMQTLRARAAVLRAAMVGQYVPWTSTERRNECRS